MRLIGTFLIVWLFFQTLVYYTIQTERNNLDKYVIHNLPGEKYSPVLLNKQTGEIYSFELNISGSQFPQFLTPMYYLSPVSYSYVRTPDDIIKEKQKQDKYEMRQTNQILKEQERK